MFSCLSATTAPLALTLRRPASCKATHGKLLDQWETIRHTLQEQSAELKGEISIYCSVTASYSFLYDILSQFRLEHPAIEIKLHTGDPHHAIDRVLATARKILRLPPAPINVPAGKFAFRRITVSPLVFITPKDGFTPPVTPGEWAETP